MNIPSLIPHGFNQLCRLRETFSRVMDSVLVNPATPDLLHSNFSRAAIGAAQDIKSFTQLMEDGRSTEVIEMANESRAKNGEGIVGWKVTEYEDWLDVKKEDACGGTNVEKEALSMIEAGSGPGVEELRAGLDRFRQIHAGIEASLDEQSKTLKVWSTEVVEKFANLISYIYLCQPKSNSISALKARLKVTSTTASTPKRNPVFTDPFSLRLAQALELVISNISLYVSHSQSAFNKC